MTDFMKTCQLFDELGIEYNTSEWKGNLYIELEEGNQKVSGYNGFMTHFKFELDGSFIEVDLYE